MVVQIRANKVCVRVLSGPLHVYPAVCTITKQTQLYVCMTPSKRIDAYAAFQCPPHITNIPMPNVRSLEYILFPTSYSIAFYNPSDNKTTAIQNRFKPHDMLFSSGYT